MENELRKLFQIFKIYEQITRSILQDYNKRESKTVSYKELRSSILKNYKDEFYEFFTKKYLKSDFLERIYLTSLHNFIKSSGNYKELLEELVHGLYFVNGISTMKITNLLNISKTDIENIVISRLLKLSDLISFQRPEEKCFYSKNIISSITNPQNNSHFFNHLNGCIQCSDLRNFFLEIVDAERNRIAEKNYSDLPELTYKQFLTSVLNIMKNMLINIRSISPVYIGNMIKVEYLGLKIQFID
ncbi:MAG: hypothetical protein H6622_14255 [Halobacteriovoraceae bacterium]|nr:hypothetical protein [Halobacteriovoraceae bacterium]